jgi:hypothetical protein
MLSIPTHEQSHRIAIASRNGMQTRARIGHQLTLHELDDRRLGAYHPKTSSQFCIRKNDCSIPLASPHEASTTRFWAYFVY